MDSGSQLDKFVFKPLAFVTAVTIDRIVGLPDIVVSFNQANSTALRIV